MLAPGEHVGPHSAVLGRGRCELEADFQRKLPLPCASRPQSSSGQGSIGQLLSIRVQYLPECRTGITRALRM
eukprot:CAMPEP_0172179162 /NCGR_PEP_ID=MMETSP1050-20130122/16458_1 /TAXON_ID=233186 /ORGANISM="Cryptomonas curvata, Strain CCAP979/52" /LENGTH=71 /DNA_ID=CAMNT_0012852001 /DNA_START=126 /DNA_END=341 /DNA_ORIENTATION=-